MTTDFKKLWADPTLPNRERKRLLAHIIEDVTLVKLASEGTTKIHVRSKGGKTETLTTLNPKSSAAQVTTPKTTVDLVDKLLDHHIYDEIADVLNKRGLRPDGSARSGKQNSHFTALRVGYLVHEYGLRSRYDRLRDQGMLTNEEMAARLGIHVHTFVRWAEHGHQARIQRPRVSVRAPGPESTDQAVQPLEPVGRSSEAGPAPARKSSRATRGGAV